MILASRFFTPSHKLSSKLIKINDLKIFFFWVSEGVVNPFLKSRVEVWGVKKLFFCRSLSQSYLFLLAFRFWYFATSGDKTFFPQRGGGHYFGNIKKCPPKLVFFNEKKLRKIRMIFDIKK